MWIVAQRKRKQKHCQVKDERDIHFSGRIIADRTYSNMQNCSNCLYLISHFIRWVRMLKCVDRIKMTVRTDHLTVLYFLL